VSEREPSPPRSSHNTQPRPGWKPTATWAATESRPVPPRPNLTHERAEWSRERSCGGERCSTSVGWLGPLGKVQEVRCGNARI